MGAAVHRGLDDNEQRLLDAVTAAAAPAVESGAATLTVEWRETPYGGTWPDYVLAPRNPQASPVRVSPTGADYFDFMVADGEATTNFELWSETEEERLHDLTAVIEAVIEGRFELSLVRSRGFFRRGDWWRVVAKFAARSREYEFSDAPYRAATYASLFDPDDERDDTLGPYRFPAYSP